MIIYLSASKQTSPILLESHERGAAEKDSIEWTRADDGC